MIFFFIGAALTIVIYSLRVGISPMPSSKKAKNAMLQVLPDDWEGIIYELGSGWGGLSVALAKKYPKAQVIGWELSPVPFVFSLLRNRRKNLRFYRKNFFHASMEADAFFCYLYPGAMKKLKVKRGILVSNTFAWPGHQAKIIELDDLGRTKIYIYSL